jgi:hypothetical protein
MYLRKTVINDLNILEGKLKLSSLRTFFFFFGGGGGGTGD